MLITPSVITQPLAASKVLKSFFNISLKLRLAPVELLEDCNLQIRISSTTYYYGYPTNFFKYSIH